MTATAAASRRLSDDERAELKVGASALVPSGAIHTSSASDGSYAAPRSLARFLETPAAQRQRMSLVRRFVSPEFGFEKGVNAVRRHLRNYTATSLLDSPYVITNRTSPSPLVTSFHKYSDKYLPHQWFYFHHPDDSLCCPQDVINAKKVLLTMVRFGVYSNPERVTDEHAFALKHVAIEWYPGSSHTGGVHPPQLDDATLECFRDFAPLLDSKHSHSLRHDNASLKEHSSSFAATESETELERKHYFPPCCGHSSVSVKDGERSGREVPDQLVPDVFACDVAPPPLSQLNPNCAVGVGDADVGVAPPAPQPPANSSAARCGDSDINVAPPAQLSPPISSSARCGDFDIEVAPPTPLSPASSRSARSGDADTDDVAFPFWPNNGKTVCLEYGVKLGDQNSGYKCPNGWPCRRIHWQNAPADLKDKANTEVCRLDTPHDQGTCPFQHVCVHFLLVFHNFGRVRPSLLELYSVPVCRHLACAAIHDVNPARKAELQHAPILEALRMRQQRKKKRRKRIASLVAGDGAN